MKGALGAGKNDSCGGKVKGVWYGKRRLALGRNPSSACRPVLNEEVRRRRVMKEFGRVVENSWRHLVERVDRKRYPPVLPASVEWVRHVWFLKQDPAGQCNEYGIDDFHSEILPVSEYGDGMSGSLTGSYRPVQGDYSNSGTRTGSYRSLGEKFGVVAWAASVDLCA
ncbi:hypothetical protein NPIL_174211 [Nephila pilipes]|uniref:Uncharacterized protein n=1 Tax=Nephila pilipes TaxID=299642 RepID=A0A8X6U400_NEPPI|nr:hypothetical protein NPIL_174211 [Nephila pilipes]